MRFELSMTYAQADFIALRKAWWRMSKPLRAMRIASRVCFLFAGGLLALIGGIGLVYWVLALFHGDSGEIASTLPISLGLTIAAVLLLSNFDDKRWGKRMWKQYRGKGDTLT